MTAAEKVVQYLGGHPGSSVATLAAVAQCHRRTVYSTLARLQVHVVAWEPIKTTYRPLYALGRGHDAPRPNARRSRHVRKSDVPAKLAALRYDPWTNMIRSLK